MYYLYFIESQKDKSYYVGITSNLTKRLDQHNRGKTRSTKSKRPFKLLYYEKYESRSEARKRELNIKRSWKTKEEIINKIKALSSNG